ncbi:hypothetical protein ACTHGU_06915 [Chitinophagaceae bacterium MMS25-I14]
MRKQIIAGIGLISAIALVTGQQPAQAQKKKSKKEKEVKEISIYDIDTLSHPVPNNRGSFHINIDREQHRADATDGKVDGEIYFSDDTTLTNILSRAILKDVDQIQVMIENMPINAADKMAESQTRIRYLRSVLTLLRHFNADVKMDPIYYRKRVANLKQLIIACNENRAADFVKENINVYTLDNSELLDLYPESRNYLYVEMGKQDPKMMIKRLREFSKEPYADDIISSAARVVPQEVYNYASSTDYALSTAVKRSKDPLVQTIVQIAQQSKSPLKAMPFLSDIYNKRKTIAEIDKITNDPTLFYKNLVRLKLQNDNLGGDSYTDELQYRGLAFVRDMNDLHESPDAVRFKGIDSFTPEELYFLMVYGQDEIYTSSFTGTFKRMMERMKPAKGDELFEKVHYDHFRTFIRMCAGYNTLSTFLATIDEGKKTELMKNFISGLEKGKEDDLEDAVDVADAFGSITDSTLSTFLLDEVRNNYERSAQIKSKKGVIVYGLLATLFKGTQAGEGSSNIISNELNLPPINLVPNKNLVNDSGTVYEMAFFFGDEDGKMSYGSFMGIFKDPKQWKITNENKYWTSIKSVTGKPIMIYANQPIAEPEGEDEVAQNNLVKYLDEKNIHPTVVIHRGHSYHLPSTIEKLTKESKIVMLGSCGGYHNLGTVLDHSPDANIISTKQVGTMAVNEPIIKALETQLLYGNDIDWINIWSSLKLYFDGRPAAEKERFNDYVPPHKNLGAIFIKAYRKISVSTER